MKNISKNSKQCKTTEKLCVGCNGTLYGEHIESILEKEKVLYDNNKRTIEDVRKKYNLELHEEYLFEECRYCKVVKSDEQRQRVQKENIQRKLGYYKDASVHNPKNDNQKKLYKMFIENPLSSYYIFGLPGGGKTTAMYAMFNYLLMNDMIGQHHIFHGDKITEAFRKHDLGLERIIKGEIHDTGFTTDQFEGMVIPNQRSYYILLDDIGKIKYSESNVMKLHGLFDSLNRKGDQFNFIITSNSGLNMLQKRLDGAVKDNDDFGGSVTRRIADKCNSGKNVIEFV